MQNSGPYPRFPMRTSADATRFRKLTVSKTPGQRPYRAPGQGAGRNGTTGDVRFPSCLPDAAGSQRTPRTRVT